MTAVLAFLGRFVFGAFLVLVCLAAMIWARFGPQGTWTLAWIVLVFVAIWGAVEAWERLGKRRRKDASDG